MEGQAARVGMSYDPAIQGYLHTRQQSWPLTPRLSSTFHVEGSPSGRQTVTNTTGSTSGRVLPPSLTLVFEGPRRGLLHDRDRSTSSTAHEETLPASGPRHGWSESRPERNMKLLQAAPRRVHVRCWSRPAIPPITPLSGCTCVGAKPAWSTPRSPEISEIPRHGTETDHGRHWIRRPTSAAKIQRRFTAPVPQDEFSASWQAR